MPEYIGREPETVAPGETVLFENRCESPVEIAAGLVFREDGDYIVSVRSGKIDVRKCGCASFKDFDAPPEVIEAYERNEKRLKEAVDEFYNVLIAEKRAEIERLKAEIAKMPQLDYDKLAENPPEYPVCVGYKCWDGKEEADNGNK